MLIERMVPATSTAKQFDGAMTVSKADNTAMEEFIVYGLLVCVALVVTGAVVGLILIRKRACDSQK